jgi:hypothetical protein
MEEVSSTMDAYVRALSTVAKKWVLDNTQTAPNNILRGIEK